jgi:hypothetical protein
MSRPIAVAVAVSASAMLAAQDGVPDPYAMDFGPLLVTTVECGGLAGTTNKAVVVRLGDRGAVAFDTELLRLAAAWTGGWLHLRGTAYDGSHGPMPSRRGRARVETRAGPGWAQGGVFADPRPIPHGPLPREQGKYGGLSLDGDQVVIDYRIGDMAVREAYALEAEGTAPIIVRTLELSASKIEQQLLVLDGPDRATQGVTLSGGDPRFALLQFVPKSQLVTIDGSEAWSDLATGAPSKSDWLDSASGSGATIAFVPEFARVHGREKPVNGDSAETLALPLLCDGDVAANDDDTRRCVWFDARKKGDRDGDDGRFFVDLKKVVDVHRINTFSWHRAERCAQQYDLFGSDADEAPDASAADPSAVGWKKIAAVDTTSLEEGKKHAAGIAKSDGLGRFRYLLFHVRRGGTFFSEIDVFADRCKAEVDSAPRPPDAIAVALRGATGASGPELRVDGSRVLLRVPAHDAAVRVSLAVVAGAYPAAEKVIPRLTSGAPVAPLPAEPAKARWGAPIVTKGKRAADGDGPFAVDDIAIPFDNPWHSRMRTAAFDFFADGRAAVSTWNGDVWIVSGLDDDLDRLEWKRFATGLFDPLGLCIVGDVVHVHGRDGITKLLDRNGDGEADRYECLDNQVLITAAFHEFAFDLQTDADGNFYFSKGAPVQPGGRGFMKIVPHHGTILKLSKDGTLATIATGLRAPNGIGVSPDGVVTSGDNEGTFMPRCRLNWIEQPGYYAGVKDTAHRTPVPDQPDLPLCWLPMEVDNSSGGQVWVTGAGWPDLADRLLHLSYGTCSAYLVLSERVDGQMQGGVVRLPAEFSSSCMRGRFSPVDGQLYVIGLQGWQTSAAREGGFHRVRRTAAPLGLPTALRTCAAGVQLTFAEPLDAETASDPDSYGVEIWNYLYSANYGSPEVSVLHPERQVAEGKPNRDPLPVTAVTLAADRRTVFLAIAGMRPVQQMRITWNVDAADGRQLRGELHHTIHALAAEPQPLPR